MSSAAHPGPRNVGGQSAQLPVPALVAAGGALGAMARQGVTLASLDVPLVAVVVVNLVGAFALGVAVSRRMSVAKAVFWRTGFLGAFTTFGGMTVQAADLGWVRGTCYVVLLTLTGLLAAKGGVRLGHRWSG